MRLKQRSALLLASVMLAGSIGMMNPIEVRAASETNTFTLTVPADTNITTSGWNDIGSVGVSDVSIASDKKISVTIENGATGRTLKKTEDATKTVGYEVKKGTSASNEAFGDSLDFRANGTQAIGAVVADFSSAEVGTYEDTINFTAALASAPAPVIYIKKDSEGTLSSESLGTATTWTYDGVAYDVYNAFIPYSSSTSWNDAMGFINALNTANYDGHSDWKLLSSEGMARAWDNDYGNDGSSVYRGGADFLWSSVESNTNQACGFDCTDWAWFSIEKKTAWPPCGLVVLRASSN